MEELQMTKATAQPSRDTAIERSLKALTGNNEQLGGLINILHGFTSRVVGPTPQAPATEIEKAQDACGLLGSLDEALGLQSHLLNKLHEIVSAIEKIA